MSLNSPHVYTSKYLFKATCEELRSIVSKGDLGSSLNPLQVLDVPAGAGALSRFLSEELHVHVTAAEFDLSKWEYTKLPINFCDLSKEIPFPSNSFDLVVCLEGIKHVPNVHQALAEFQRVLKPGGKFLITIPNDLNVQSRLRYFFDGFVDVDWNQPMHQNSDNEKSFLYMASQLSFPYLYYFLQRSGLPVIYTKHDRIRGWAAILMILFYPFIFIKTLKAGWSNKKLALEMVSPTWLAGRRNIIVCEKK